MICAHCGKREATEKIPHIEDAIAGSNAKTGHYYQDWCDRCAEGLRKKVASSPQLKYVREQRAAGVPFEVIQQELVRRFDERWRKRGSIARALLALMYKWRRPTI